MVASQLVDDTRFGNHLQLGLYNPSPVHEEEWLRWMLPTHVEETLLHDGYVAAQMFKRRSFQFPLDPMTYLGLGIYEMDRDPRQIVSRGFTPLPGWAQIGGRTIYGSLVSNSAIYTPQHERQFATGSTASISRSTLLLIFAAPRAVQEASYIDWVTGTHIPDILAIEGFVAAQHFARHSSQANSVSDVLLPYPYMTMYEIEGSPERAWRAAYQGVSSGQIRLPEGIATWPNNPAFGSMHYMGHRSAVYSAFTDRKAVPAEGYTG